MGEEAKQEEVKETAAAPPKAEEKPAGEPKEEKVEEAKPSPPPPIVLFVDLHCVGCAKKIERSILKCRGVEEVETDIEKNTVTVKGAVDPQALCSRIQKKTSRTAKLLSPVQPPADAAGATQAEPKPPQASAPATVELLVNMHCEACAQQLRKKILKMRGVQAAETDLSSKKVTVTGTVSGEKLVEYIHRRTGKVARIVPPPAPPEEKKADGDGEKKTEDAEKPQDDKKDGEEKKEEADQKPAEGTKEEKAAGEGGGDEPKKEAAQPVAGAEEMVRRMMSWNGPSGYAMSHEEEMARRMMMTHHWMPMPMLVPSPAMYVFEQPHLPPPQMFSDENPNACCIS